MVSLIVLILDESGSMTHTAEETVRSINDYISGLEPDQLFTFVTFATATDSVRITQVYKELPVSQVPPILPPVFSLIDTQEPEPTSEPVQYRFNPCGGTPLCEAILRTLECLTPEYLFEHNITSVVTVIVTDGMDNSSGSGYTHERVREFLQTTSFTTIYLGADQDAVEIGCSYGIRPELSLQTPNGFSSCVPALSRVTTMASSGAVPAFSAVERQQSAPVRHHPHPLHQEAGIMSPPTLRRLRTDVF